MEEASKELKNVRSIAIEKLHLMARNRIMNAIGEFNSDLNTDLFKENFMRRYDTSELPNIQLNHDNVEFTKMVDTMFSTDHKASFWPHVKRYSLKELVMFAIAWYNKSDPVNLRDSLTSVDWRPWPSDINDDTYRDIIRMFKDDIDRLIRLTQPCAEFCEKVSGIYFNAKLKLQDVDSSDKATRLLEDATRCLDELKIIA